MRIKPSSYTVTMYSVYCNRCGKGVIKDIPYKTNTVTCPACGETFELDWDDWEEEK